MYVRTEEVRVGCMCGACVCVCNGEGDKRGYDLRGSQGGVCVCNGRYSRDSEEEGKWNIVRVNGWSTWERKIVG